MSFKPTHSAYVESFNAAAPSAWVCLVSGHTDDVVRPSLADNECARSFDSARLFLSETSPSEGWSIRRTPLDTIDPNPPIGAEERDLFDQAAP
jgi:hypothetical protein